MVYLRVSLSWFSVFGKGFGFELRSDESSIAILFGAPGSGKTHLLNLVATPLLVTELMIRRGVEPSKALDTVFSYLFPRYRSMIRSDTEVLVEVEIGGYRARLVMEKHGTPMIDTPYRGLGKYLAKDQRLPYIYLDEYRVRRLHALLRSESVEERDVLSNHLMQWISYAKRLQEESEGLSTLFDECSRILLKPLGFASARPLDLANGLTEFNTSLMHESYTVLNMATLSLACLALCTEEPSLVLVDMPEHGLVPSLLREVAQALTKHIVNRAKQKMLVIATHSPLLAALIIHNVRKLGEEKRVRVYEMELERRDGRRVARFRELERGRAPTYLVNAFREIAREVTTEL